MGIRKALRLGITKGVQHNLNPIRAINLAQSKAIISVLKCTECKHASKSHTRRRPQFVPMPREQLAKLIQETGFPGSMGFHECIFYYCDECDLECSESKKHE